MKNSFCVRNKLGYGYHAIALTDDGELAGYNVFSPTFYKDGLMAVVSGSTYVRPKFRSHEMLFMNMVQVLRKAVKDDGYKIEIGVPNHNSEKFALRILKFKPVAELNYYMIPLNVSRTLNKPFLRMFDGIIHSISRIHIKLNWIYSRLCNTKERQVIYELDCDDNYWGKRFGGKCYASHIEGKYKAYWLKYNENGANAAYLMDFREEGKRTYKALYFAVKAIAEDKGVDAILFVGFLWLKQSLLFKVPKRFVPKRLPLTYYVLNKEDRGLYADMADKHNWNFSLMNFDVR